MTRVQYLNELYRRLGGMSREQAEQHLTYYAEMLADRMEEGMTEEEAVASMEDVDTIAQRILQEEGVKEENGTAEEPVTPPRRPEPPPRPVSPDTGGKDAFAGGSDTAPPAKRRRWVWPAVIAALLCLAVISLLLPSRRSRQGIAINDNGVYIGDILAVDDNGIRIGNFLYVGPDGIRVGSAAVGGSTANSAVDGSWGTEDSIAVVEDNGTVVITDVDDVAAMEYSGEGDHYVSPQGVSRIEVDWVSGEVYIEVGDAEEICFFESSTAALDENTRLNYTVKDGQLSIKFSKKSLNNFRETKQLTMLIPQSLAESLEELEVDTTSADVTIIGVDGGKLSLGTTSGECYVEGSYGSVEADTTSGNVTLIGSIREVEFDSVSGELYFEGEDPLYRLEADTTSGDVTLALPTVDFTLLFKTVSGTLYQGSYTLTKPSGQKAYVSGNGECQIEIDTVSGNLWLQ